MHHLTPSSVLRIRRRHSAAILGTAALFLAALQLSGKPVPFDIPAQPAPAALTTFGKQATMEVAFAFDELRDVRTKAVKGDYEPAKAMSLLLDGSGFTARRSSPTNFVVSRSAAKPGAIEGEVRHSGTGRPIPGAQVRVSGTDESAITDPLGRFRIADVAAGPRVLTIEADGMQKARITDVTVTSGHTLTLSPISIPAQVPGIVQMEDYIVSAKKNDGVIELDPYEVQDRKVKAYSDASVDLPRTIDDVQPYYVFDAKTIAQYGATTPEDFLRKRLTMSTQYANRLTDGTIYKGISEINLRGVGSDGTLVLLNGRRLPALSTGSGLAQGDINGIPLDAIDRIEVLPSSAAALYGGAALGGMVNIILKSNYTGGGISFTYDSPLSTDAGDHTVNFNYSLPLEGGRTQLRLSAGATRASGLTVQDRTLIIDNYFAVLRNYPALVSATSPYSGGTTPNIASTASLTLKNGTALGSTRTYVPAGTAPGTNLGPGLIANAGKYNMEPNPYLLGQQSLLTAVTQPARRESVSVSLSRQFTPWLEFYSEFDYLGNSSPSRSSPFTSVSVPASSAVNPFQQTVTVTLPTAYSRPVESVSRSRKLVNGVKLRLPNNWIAELDYDWNASNFGYSSVPVDSTALAADVLAGLVNPFVDTLEYPLDLDRYLGRRRQSWRSTDETLGVRAAGDLWTLPWGVPTLNLISEHHVQALKSGYAFAADVPITTANVSRIDSIGHANVNDSVAAELHVPLVTAKNGLSLLRGLELQLNARQDYYRVDTGSGTITSFPNRNPVTYTYSPASPTGGFVQKTARYEKFSPTVGFKWLPVDDVIVRASFGGAFLPPTFSQLVPNPVPAANPTTVLDPKTGASYGVTTYSGGNPNLEPKTSTSWNAGIIYQPKWAKGLRLNLEYSYLDQRNVIVTPTAVQLVLREDDFPGRVVRDANGKIVSLDLSTLNANRFKTAAWDFSVNYRRSTALGVFDFQGAATVVIEDYQQQILGGPVYKLVNNPNEGGQATPKLNGTLGWSRKSWNAGWRVYYIGSYNAPGSADSVVGQGGTGLATIFPIYRFVGSPTIASQTYHDVFFGYDFDRAAEDRSWLARATRGLNIQMGFNNVFNTPPPFDVAGNTGAFYSAYGDIRLRTIWAKLTKTF